MAKIVLGARPKNFPREINVTLHDGSKGTIGVSYVYRTRSEYGAFVDAAMKASREAADAALRAALDATDASQLKAAENGMEQVLKKTSQDNISFVMDAVDGWNLDAPFSRAAVEQLADELPQAIMAIIENYRFACTEGRLGN